MGFGGSLAENQDDIVAERTDAKPEAFEEELKLPGLNRLHAMRDEELVEFFVTILKSRPTIRELSLSLGDFPSKEVQSKLPNVDKLSTLDFQKVAKVLAMACTSKGCVGIRAVVLADQQGELTSRLFIRTADKEVHLPVYDQQGRLVKEGDAAYSPKLTIIYKPV